MEKFSSPNSIWLVDLLDINIKHVFIIDNNGSAYKISKNFKTSTI